MKYVFIEETPGNDFDKEETPTNEFFRRNARKYFFHCKIVRKCFFIKKHPAGNVFFNKINDGKYF